MKRITGILYGILFFLVGACFEPPQFSNQPSIAIEDVRVQKVGGAAVADSLIITVNFQDGDGNIGISGSENTPPFHERWYFLKTPLPTCEPGLMAPCTKISYVDDQNMANYVTYKSRRGGAPYDTLPAFTKPYDCQNYVVLKKAGNVTIDTLYSQLNPRYFNLFIRVEYKSGSDFIPYEYNNAPYPNCDIYGLNARLPILAKDGDVNSKLPLEGVITYKLTSASFTPLLGKVLRLKIKLMDRDGNISNEDTSKEFVFN